MKRGIIALGLMAAFMLGTGPIAKAKAQQPANDPLKVGDKAPDFDIPGTVPIPAGGGTVGIASITGQGKSVVLAFFPKAFTGG